MQAQLSIVLNQAYILSVTWRKILKMSRKGECLLQFRTGKHHSDAIPHSVTQADTIRDTRSTQPHECLNLQFEDFATYIDRRSMTYAPLSRYFDSKPLKLQGGNI